MSSADVAGCCEVGWRASWIERCMRGSGQRWRVSTSGNRLASPSPDWHAVERYFRDSKLLPVGEGTNAIQRLMIARRLLEHDKI